MLQELLSGGPLPWISLQAQFHEVLERLAEVSVQNRWRVLRDEEQDFHRVNVRIWWLSFRKFESRDAERPNIRFMVVT